MQKPPRFPWAAWTPGSMAGQAGGEAPHLLVDQDGGDRQRLSADERGDHRHVLKNTHIAFPHVNAQGNASGEEGGRTLPCDET